MASKLFPDSGFPPGRNDPCYCGSGERYKRCCGTMGPDRPVPFGIGVRENFLTHEECQTLIALIDSKEAVPYKARDPNQNMALILDPSRVCSWARMDDSQQVLDDLVAKAFEEVIIPVTGVEIAFYEQPQLLRYEPGGFYKYHIDAGHRVPEKQAWCKAVDRDISLLIYLRDDFTGGELHFNRLDYNLTPKAGMLVWFPSDARFEHMAKPVITGSRYAVVSWGAAKDVERVQDERAKNTIDWITREKKTA